MKTKQKNKYESYRAVRALLTEKVAASNDAGLVAQFAVFLDHLAVIDALVPTQTGSLSGRMRTRNQAFAEAEQATLAVAGRARAHALAARLPELQVRVRFRPNAFPGTRLAERLRRMREVHAAALEVLPQLAPLGVTADMLSDLERKIAAAASAFDLVRQTAIDRKVATAELKEAFRVADAHLREGLDGVMLAVRATDPTLYAAYREARNIIDRAATLPSRADPAARAAAPTQNVQPLAA